MKNTVLITGASSGLGEEFAWQLAAQDYNLLLVARRSEKLALLAKKLTEKYPQLTVLVLSEDLNESTAVETIQTFIEAQNIRLVGLINNAGFGARGAFSELPIVRQQQMLQVNIIALTLLTHTLITHLKREKYSFIINVASTAAFQAGPHLALYYASKAFVLSFSEALHEELKGQVAVSALCPGATKTEFADVAGMSDSLVFKLRVMDKDVVVKHALKNRGKAIVIPGLMNKVAVIAVKLLPRFMSRKLAYQIQK
ncbi:SDR family NAD(P)-dependent oxidoreductase [Psychromonas sp. Urea-02u-13]|uniref:SDR family NAD(P)-dependent oxidoreductase n=1 Tax=Psychromonas sp. Urea-02u-13 TaxID=2058326 RepID=UPI000C32CEC4|nr:SDR family oxidoreductase [Psychromonas sp. Urea-02u-13]PKG40275.1 short-chain dehydrogenase [Psychromonas sp. Urea-02u-13]